MTLALLLGASLLALILLISVARMPTFLAFLLVSICLSLAWGFDISTTIAALQHGMGSTLGSIVPIILTGAWLGSIAARTGATTVLSEAIVRRMGTSRLPLAFLCTGFLVGLPLFYAVGFFLLVPLALSTAQRHRIPPLALGMPLLASLSIAQGYLPPHPAPYYLVTHLPGADMGRTLGWGIVVSLPAMLLSGLLFGRIVRDVPSQPMPFVPEKLPERLPPPLSAGLVLLLPVLLIGIKSFSGASLKAGHWASQIIDIAGEPILALLASLLAAIVGLGMRNGHRWSDMQSWLHETSRDMAPLIFTFAGAGALKAVLEKMQVGESAFQLIGDAGIPPLLLGWSIAAMLRIATGSSTVAGITTAGLILPVMASSVVDPDMTVLAIGAGSMVMSHVNDSGFWLFRDWFGVSIRDTLRTWTVMETLVALTGLAGVMALDRILHG